MVDCRNCRNSFRIWGEECGDDVSKFKLVCLKRDLFIDDEYITTGPCEDYVDVDGYDPRE